MAKFSRRSALLGAAASAVIATASWPAIGQTTYPGGDANAPQAQPAPSPAVTAAPPATGVAPAGQTAPAPSNPAAPVGSGGSNGNGEIVVTGSVFKQANLNTPSPVTVISAETLQLRGISTITNAIQSLSSNGSGNLTNAFSANGAFAGGASAPSLRGLTTDSTLVLFDGLRAAYYPLADDGQRNFVDTNTIPESIVDRVETLKDGASSTYGADAVAGVVNIILKKEIQGLNGLVEGGISKHGDAGERRASVTYGYGDLASQGFNIYANFEYERDDLVYNRDRGFPYNTGDLRSITGLDANGQVVHDLNNNSNGLDSSGNYQGLGSTIVPYARQIIDGVQGNGQLINAAAGCGPLTPHNVGDVGTGNLGTICEQDLVRDYSVITPRQQRLGGTLHATANVGDNAQAYAVFTYYQNDTFSPGTAQNSRQISYTGNLSTASLALPAVLPNGTLNPNNPFAADGTPAVLYYRFGDIPNSTEQFSQTYRGAAGISGSFGNDWGYSLDVTGMNSDLRNTYKGFIYAQGLIDAVNNGTYNFLDPAANSQAVRDSIAPTDIQHAKSELYQVQGTITKKLFDLPGGPLQFAIGGAGRYEKVNDPSANPGAIDVSNPNPGQQYFSLNPFFSGGHRYVESGYFEIDAPIIKALLVNASGRYDHYSTGFSHFSPKIGAKFTPVKQFTVRGTFSKGFRVPSFAETNSETIGYVNVTPPPNFQALHPNATGTGPNAYASQYSLGLDTVGNPNLKPEKATNYTLGGIFQPANWLNFTVDYYHIKKTRVISASSYNEAFDAYYAGDPIPAGYSVVQDAPDPDHPNAEPRVLLIRAPYINASSLVTSGLDFQANATLSLTNDLKFFSSGEATYVIKLNQTYPGQPTQHYAGTLGPYAITSASGTPRWRANWQNTLSYKAYSLTATAYYTSGYKESAEDATGGGTAGDCYANAAAAGVPAVFEDGVTPIRCNVKRFIDVDLHAAVKATDKFTFYVDVQNVLNARSPFDPTTYGGYQYNSSWSQAGIIGRYFKAGATFSF